MERVVCRLGITEAGKGSGKKLGRNSADPCCRKHLRRACSLSTNQFCMQVLIWEGGRLPGPSAGARAEVL